MRYLHILLRLPEAAVLVMALLVPGQAAAQTPEPIVSSATLYVENDVVPHAGDNNDQNYTGGFGFHFQGRFITALKLNSGVDLLDRLTGVSRAWDSAVPRYSFLLYGTGFTPDTLNEDDVIPDDRPYGSLVGIAIRKLTVEPAAQNSTWASELAVGMLGLRAAENIQGRLHAYLRKKNNSPTPYAPLGWSHQISDGGELTGLYRVSYDRLLLGDNADIARKHWQLVGGGEAMVGYYTNAAAVTSGRLGWFNSHYWEFTTGAMAIATQASLVPDVPRYELFLFGGLRGRLVGYNALLQGQFKNSDHTVTPERLIAETDFGLAATVRVAKVNVQAVWNVGAGRTAEFKSTLARRHTWGSLMFSANWGMR